MECIIFPGIWLVMSVCFVGFSVFVASLFVFFLFASFRTFISMMNGLLYFFSLSLYISCSPWLYDNNNNIHNIGILALFFVCLVRCKLFVWCFAHFSCCVYVKCIWCECDILPLANTNNTHRTFIVSLCPTLSSYSTRFTSDKKIEEKSHKQMCAVSVVRIEQKTRRKRQSSQKMLASKRRRKKRVCEREILREWERERL